VPTPTPPRYISGITPRHSTGVRGSGEHNPVAARATWLRARARNALRRTVLVASVGGATFVTALMALVLVPRSAGQAARTLTAQLGARTDTVPLVAAAVRARARLAAAESSLAAARRTAAQFMESGQLPAPVDTLPPELIARRDTLAAQHAALTRLIARAENAPLPASFRALAASGLMRAEPRVRVLLDSLAEIERDREAFGAVGGVDPVFVALTARLTAVGRSIQAIAEDKRAAIRRELAVLRPPAPPATTAASAAVDTTAPLAALAGAGAEAAAAQQALADAQRRNQELEARAERARQLANVSAPPVALLFAALVLGLVAGSGAGLVAELRRPRVADAREAARVADTRVLAVIRPRPPVPERMRRRADHELPPLLDPQAETSRLLYLHFAASGNTLPLITVTGEEPGVVATVAANLAAAAAADARSTLLVDGDLEACAVAGVMRVPPEPGLAAIVEGTVDWARAIVTRSVGRDRALDVVPAGAWFGGDGGDGGDRGDGGSFPAALPDAMVAETMRRDLARLARRYDLAVLVAPSTLAELGGASPLPSPDVLLCARTAHTRLANLARLARSLRGAGTRIRGVVLWDAEPPHVPTKEEMGVVRRPMSSWTETRRTVATAGTPRSSRAINLKE